MRKLRKTLSFILITAMLLSVVPAFTIFADGPEEINSVQEYMDFVTELNNGTRTGAQNIKVTADLDFDGITDYVPINSFPNNSTLDFDNHIISNLNYTISASSGEKGLIINSSFNNTMIKNLTLKDSSFTVTGEGNPTVGGVVGRLDRGLMTNINTDNFTLTTDSTGKAGLFIGNEHWCAPNTEVVLCGNLKDAVIDAPNAVVGILVAHAEDWDGNGGMHVAVKNLTGNVTILSSANIVSENTFIGNNRLTKIESESFENNQDQYFYDTATISLTFVNETPQYKFITIDSAQEFYDFTKAINAGSFSPSGTIEVTADLDMGAYSGFEPINSLGFIFDFNDHTVSNLVVNNSSNNNAGLIANNTKNNAVIDNIRISNCKLIANSAYNVGIVLGRGDRAVVPNAEINNVTVESTSAERIGGVVGERGYSSGQNQNMDATIDDVIFNAPNATKFGILVGKAYDDYGHGTTVVIGTVNATKIQINLNSSYVSLADGAVGEIGEAGIVDESSANVSISLATYDDPAVGYVAPVSPTAAPELVSRSVILTGEIGLAYYFIIPSAIELESCYVDFVIGEGKGGERTARADFNASAYKENAGVKRYRFVCWLTASEMAQEVKATFNYEGGALPEVSDSVTGYISDYEDYTGEKNPQVTAIVHALADYGHYGQILLSNKNGWTFDKYAEVITKFSDSFDTDAIAASVAGYTFSKSIDGTAVTNVTYSLSLESKIAVNIYLTAGSDPGASASFNGKVYPAELQSDGRYKIKIDNIPINKLGDTISVTGDDGLSVELSALSYVRSILGKSEADTGSYDAVAALYNFYAATKDYIG